FNLLVCVSRSLHLAPELIDSSQQRLFNGDIPLGQGLWVVESNQRPVAFAWSRTDRDTVRLIELYAEAGEVAADEVALELLQPLLAHVEREHGGKFSRLEVPAESVHGVDPESLRDAGLALVAEVWAKGLLPSD
ncbi:hypothetical protein LCGC14_2184850, partial [marine sediment metagenome]